MERVRKAGILLHITSLPSPYGVGDLGGEAFRFVENLKEAKQKVWQILPLNPTEEKFGNSPYSSTSLFAGNYLLISPEWLYKKGLLKREDLEVKDFPEERVDYPRVYEYKERLLRKAFERFKPDCEFEKFLLENSYWLEDYSLFQALRVKTKREWYEWEEPIKFRKEEALKKAREELKEEVLFWKFVQFVFFEQWFELKNLANSKGIKVIGDLPIYPSYASVEVWRFPEIFKLDEDLKPLFVAGVPPDFFSETGQLWGNPVYNWEKLREANFFFFVDRIKHNLKMFDILRLDHFRGYIAYWEVPYGEKTAVKGRWVTTPYWDFFKRILSEFSVENFIAEDLGFITDEVRYVREKLDFVSSRVLQFAFYEKNSEHLPHNLDKNTVLYTGTHDNAPLKGWFEELSQSAKENLFNYLGKELNPENVSKELIRLCYSSVAFLVVVPMQDILNLGKEATMNIPGKPFGNWEWRMKRDYEIPEWLVLFVETYGR